MITIKLQGGLGNQLFQYATACALAQYHGSSVAFDLRAFHASASEIDTTPRAYELGAFGISPVQPPWLDTLAIGMQAIPYRNQLKKRVRLWRRLTEYQEKSQSYESDIFNKTSARTYLVGYFQSERYFAHIKELLRYKLKFTHEPEIDLASFAGTESLVSLHIRRGDYVTNPKARQLHGLCSLEYYQRATSYLANRLGPIHLAVFSDDQAWARKHVLLPYPVTFVEGHQGTDSYKDMQLMSRCAHHVVANSSFSWWGAWLNPSPDKIVVTPTRWLAREVDATESADRIPPGWIRI